MMIRDYMTCKAGFKWQVFAHGKRFIYSNLIAITMNKKGYGVMSIKKEVIEEIKSKAKEEEKTISTFLSDILKQPYSNKEEKEYSNDIATEIKELKEELKKILYSNSIATDKEGLKEGLKELSDKDIKKIAGQMELAIGMYIESGVMKAVKSLR